MLRQQAHPGRQVRPQLVGEVAGGSEALRLFPARVHLLVQQLLLCEARNLYSDLCENPWKAPSSPVPTTVTVQEIDF